MAGAKVISLKEVVGAATSRLFAATSTSGLALNGAGVGLSTAQKTRALMIAKLLEPKNKWFMKRDAGLFILTLISAHPTIPTRNLHWNDFFGICARRLKFFKKPLKKYQMVGNSRHQIVRIPEIPNQ